MDQLLWFIDYDVLIFTDCSFIQPPNISQVKLQDLQSFNQLNQMKNSNSRDKNVKTLVSPPVNKLMKTDIQQPKREELDRTNYNRPASGKKLQSTKVLPPKGPPSKKQFNVEDHMTESRITQAKQGLQLLKKKMSSKGLSREKITPSQQTYAEKPITSLKTVSSNKAEETQYENRNSNMPPKKIDKKPSSQQDKPPVSGKTTTSSKNINDNRPTPQNERKQPPPPVYEEYRNQQMEIPIKPKKDFNALLEEELRKQKQGKSSLANNKPAKSNFNKYDEYPPEQEQIQLIKCRHCERMFGEAAIEKHEKICLKVFMSKRKAFDSAAYRAPEVEGIQQIQAPSKKVQPPSKAKKQPPPKVEEEAAIPKWKAASLAFRANLKQAKGVAITAQQKQAADIAQGLVPCNYCGRKFNQKAAARHIAFCQTKSKQIPRMNTTMKKK